VPELVQDECTRKSCRRADPVIGDTPERGRQVEPFPGSTPSWRSARARRLPPAPDIVLARCGGRESARSGCTCPVGYRHPKPLGLPQAKAARETGMADFGIGAGCAVRTLQAAVWLHGRGSAELALRPVKVVMATPRQCADVTARIVTDRLSQLWGQQVVSSTAPARRLMRCGAGGSRAVTATRCTCQFPHRWSSCRCQRQPATQHRARSGSDRPGR